MLLRRGGLMALLLLLLLRLGGLLARLLAGGCGLCHDLLSVLWLIIRPLSRKRSVAVIGADRF